jgi:hypothetical protein
MRAEKNKKEISSGAKIVSAKHRIPRFSSEHVKDRYVVPSLWQKAEERAIKNHESKQALMKQSKVIKASKKAKMLDGIVKRVDS